MTTKRLDPIHPGEILEEEFMAPLGLSANALAKRIDVPVTRISEIVRGNRGITADTALRLARLLGTSSELWLGLQAEYDLRMARREVSAEIQRRIIPMKRHAPPYGEQAITKSTVGERTDPYGASTIHRRTRDRRPPVESKRLLPGRPFSIWRTGLLAPPAPRSRSAWRKNSLE